MKDDTFQVEQYKKKLAKDLKRAKTGKLSTPVVFSHTVRSCYIRPKNRKDPKLIRNPKIFWILIKNKDSKVRCSESSILDFASSRIVSNLNSSQLIVITSILYMHNFWCKFKCKELLPGWFHTFALFVQNSSDIYCARFLHGVSSFRTIRYIFKMKTKTAKDRSTDGWTPWPLTFVLIDFNATVALCIGNLNLNLNSVYRTEQGSQECILQQIWFKFHLCHQPLD